MKFLETIHRLERLDQLIRMKAIGDPKALASRLKISERTLYNLLDQLRDLKYSFMNLNRIYFLSVFKFFSFGFGFLMALFISKKSLVVDTTESILLIGDSYFYTVNVDSILNCLAIENGKNIHFELVAFPAMSFMIHMEEAANILTDPRTKKHYNSNPTLELLKTRQWDKIIIQIMQLRPNVNKENIVDPLIKLKKRTKGAPKLILLFPSIGNEIFPLYSCGYNNSKSELDCYMYNTIQNMNDTIVNFMANSINLGNVDFINMADKFSNLHKIKRLQLYSDDLHLNKVGGFALALSIFQKITNQENIKCERTLKKYLVKKHKINWDEFTKNII